MAIQSDDQFDELGPATRRALPPPFGSRNEALKWAENDVLRAFGERMHVVTDDGHVIHSLETDRYEIPIPDDVLADMRDATSIHNHPEERGFSIEDIVTGLTAGEWQSRVVTQQYRYIMEYPVHPIEIDVLAHDFWLTWQKYANVLVQHVAQGTLNPDEAESVALHAAWQEVADLHGLLYRREVRSKS